MAVAITRTGLSARELRAEALRTKDSYQARRLLALEHFKVAKNRGF